MERLAAAVQEAAEGERGRNARISTGLRAGLDFLAADPAVAHLLLAEALNASGPARLQHERSLKLLAQALSQPAGGVSAETARLQAGGLVSHLSGRVLAGEAQGLRESHDLLLEYLLAPLPPSPATARNGAVLPASGG